MKIPDSYSATQPTLAELDAIPGPLILEFGTNWCPHCQAAQAVIAQGFADYHAIPYFKIEDGKGRRLGRYFQVKLWPTLILLGASNGANGILAGNAYRETSSREHLRLVRPSRADQVTESLNKLPPWPVQN